ncbi:UbiA prenyltransferase family, partial [Blyttiomyces helicus]
TQTKLRWKPSPDFSADLYLDLSKAKLSAFVILTTMAGYAMAPGAADVPSLLWTTLGTALCVGSANAINQWVEAPYDAQMSRTRNRVLVRHAMSPLHAFGAGAGAGIAGVGILATCVNPLVAALGAANVVLYTCVYTPLKRTSIANTWAGAVVGAIPPMMGWAACTGGLEPGAWLLAAVLYSWQFPHFNSLSWNLRPDYSKAGYRMMSVTDPALNGRVALRHSIALFPMGWAAPALGLTSWWFALDSTIVNAVMAYGAVRFWRRPSDKSARELFFGSLVHLPVFLALLMIHK